MGVNGITFRKCFIKRFLRLFPLIAICTIAYEIFSHDYDFAGNKHIWHNPFYILIKLFNWNINLNSYVTMIGYTVVCYLFGTFSYYCIERPISKWIDGKQVY